MVGGPDVAQVLFAFLSVSSLSHPNVPLLCPIVCFSTACFDPDPASLSVFCVPVLSQTLTLYFFVLIINSETDLNHKIKRDCFKRKEMISFLLWFNVQNVLC